MLTQYRVVVDQESVLGDLKENYRSVKNILEGLGFYVIEARELNESVLANAKLLIIPGKRDYKFLASEVKMLLDGVLRGLNLLILLSSGGDCGSNTNVQEILEPLGVYIRCDSVEQDGSEEVIVELERRHALLEGVYEVKYVSGCSLMVKKRATTEIVLRTPSNAKPAEVPILVATRYGNGRVVIVGSYRMFEDGVIDADNARLFANIISWLAKRTFSPAHIEEVIAKSLVVVERPPKVVAPPVQPVPAPPPTEKEEIPKPPTIKTETFREQLAEKAPITVPLEAIQIEKMVEEMEFAIKELEETVSSPAPEISPPKPPAEVIERPPPPPYPVTPPQKLKIPEVKLVEEKPKPVEKSELVTVLQEIVAVKGALSEAIDALVKANEVIIKANQQVLEALEQLKEKLEKVEERLKEMTSHF